MNLRPLLLFAVIMVSIAGCQGNPTVPSVNTDGKNPSLSNSEAQGAHKCLGFQYFVLDTLSMKISLIPARAVDLHLNITGVLNAAFGVKVSIVPGETEPQNGIFTFDITLQHPFASKPGLAGFDVKGILLTPGTLAVGSLMFADADETRLENADGYTRWWNPTEFTQSGMFGYTQGMYAKTPAANLTATVNPYKYFADALNATEDAAKIHNIPLDDDTGRGVFTAGKSNTRRYRIKFPMNPGPEIVFGYAIDASWAAPTPNPPSEVPDDFPINANQPEPYDLVLTPTLNTLFYDSESGMKGGVLRLTADAYDWQGQYAGNIAGEIKLVRAYAPGLTLNSADGILLGENSTSAQYSIELTGITEISQPGKAIVAVRAESLGATYDQGLSFPAPTSKISAWQEITVDVKDPNCEADSNNSMPEATILEAHKMISDTMCEGVDDTDWYFFTVEPKYKAEGRIKWSVDALQAGFELYDVNAVQVAASSSAGTGIQELELDTLDLDPGTYFIRLNVSQFSPGGSGTLIYLLEPDFEIVNGAPLNPVDITPDNLDAELSWVEQEGNYAFASGPAGYWAFDISDKLSPTLVSRVRADSGAEPAYYYPYLYGCEDPSGNPAGIDLVDFSDPSDPILLEDALVINNEVDDIVMDSQYLYVAQSTAVGWLLSIYDYLADPESPVWVNDFILPGEPIDMCIVDPEGSQTRLVILEKHKMRSYLVEDPLEIHDFGEVNLMIGVDFLDVDVDGYYLLVSWVDNGLAWGVIVLTWSPILGLEKQGFVIYPGEGSAISVSGSTCYIADDLNGITTVDFSNPDSPEAVSETDVISKSRFVDAEGDTLLCITDHSGFQTYDLSLPLNPIMAGYTTCLNVPVGGVFFGDYGVFIQNKDLYTNLNFVDLSEITDPKLITLAVYFPIFPDLITSHGNQIAIGSSFADFLVFFNGEGLPDFTGTSYFGLPSDISSIVFTDTRCYAWLANNFVDVIDTSAFPVVSDLGLVLTPSALYGTVVHGDYLYGYTSQILRVFNISNINMPVPANNIPLGHDIKKLIIRKNSLYVCTSDTLEIYDLSNPTTPSLVGSVGLPYAPDTSSMVIDGQYAYVSDAVNPTVAVNIWPPDDPQVLGDITEPTPDFPKANLLFNNGILYELHEKIGLKMYDLY